MFEKILNLQVALDSNNSEWHLSLILSSKKDYQSSVL